MDRSTARALVVTTLSGLSLFDHVLDHEPDSFTELSAPRETIATVYAKSQDLVGDARALFDQPCELWIAIYIRRAAGSGADVEDSLDELTPACMAALWGLDDVTALNASEAGYTPRPLDGKPYRMERFWVRFGNPQGF